MRRHALLFFVAPFVLFGCADEREPLVLAVELRTDYRAGIEFVRARIEAGRADGSIPAQIVDVAVEAAEGDEWLGGRTLGEVDGVASGDVRVVVTLFGPDGSAVAQQPIRIDVGPVSRSVTMVMTRDCRDVSCPADEDTPAMSACLSGMCTDESCSSDDLALCPGPACTSDGACDFGLPACASGRCIGGRCFVLADDAKCSTGICGADDGCSAEDAGVADGS